MPDFAKRLASILRIPYDPCVKKTRETPQQKEMKNSWRQAANLDGVFSITGDILPGPCLLIDDVTTSGWTLTVIAALLRQAGCGRVYPMALALNISGQA